MGTQKEAFNRRMEEIDHLRAFLPSLGNHGRLEQVNFPLNGRSFNYLSSTSGSEPSPTAVSLPGLHSNFGVARPACGASSGAAMSFYGRR